MLPARGQRDRMAEHTETDVVAFLKSQHDEVENLINTVQTTTGDHQREAFQCLVRLLAVHETAEEEVVHPVAQREPGGEEIVQQRLSEEGEAKEALAALEKLEVGTPEFAHEFAKVAASVKEHAEQEEQKEFPLLSGNEDETFRKRLATMVEKAEKMAPTHPHPHAPESALGNLAVGPFAAVADRVRDALHSG